MSMIGWAARPGTAVLPTCAIATAAGRRVSARRRRKASKLPGQAGSYSTTTTGPCPALPANAEEDHVAVLDTVLPPFHAELPGRSQRLHRTGLDELVDARHLGPDELLDEVGVDHPGRDRRWSPILAGPGAHLGLARRE